MILILEDNAERIERFKAVLKEIAPGMSIRNWRSAPKMVQEVGEWFPQARLISLDHDLDPQKGSTEDPGEGVDVTRFLATRAAVCPVIVHTSNIERGRVMMNDPNEAG